MELDLIQSVKWYAEETLKELVVVDGETKFSKSN
jgi:hypothetical protein